MRIGLFMSHTDPRGGGGYTFEHEILTSLGTLAQESHHQFMILTLDPVSGDENKTSTEKFKLVYVKRPFWSRVGRSLLYFILKGSPPELFPRWRSGFLDGAARKLGIEFLLFFGGHGIPPDIPYAIVVWDVEHRMQPWFPEVSSFGVWDAREFNYSSILPRAAFVITGTEIGREQVEFLYRVPRQRIKILPHPTPFIDESELRPDRIALFEKYGLKDNFLLYPANFWAHKNHANLLRALKFLREKLDLNLTLVFTGHDMGNEPYIRRLSSNLGLDTQVSFLGFTSRQELLALYKNAFALTYISFGGPENMPPLEGFSLGCPVIAADIAGAREQLSDAALLVDPKSPEQIAEAIKKLYDNPQLRETLIAKGKERALRFTGDDFVRGLFSIFDEFEPIRRCWPPN